MVLNYLPSLECSVVCEVLRRKKMTSRVCMFGNCLDLKLETGAVSQAVFKGEEPNSIVVLTFSHRVHCLVNRVIVDPPQESLQFSRSSSGVGCMSTTLSVRPFGRIIIETDNNKNIHIT